MDVAGAEEAPTEPEAPEPALAPAPEIEADAEDPALDAGEDSGPGWVFEAIGAEELPEVGAAIAVPEGEALLALEEP